METSDLQCTLLDIKERLIRMELLLHTISEKSNFIPELDIGSASFSQQILLGRNKFLTYKNLRKIREKYKIGKKIGREYFYTTNEVEIINQEIPLFLKC